MTLRACKASAIAVLLLPCKIGRTQAELSPPPSPVAPAVVVPDVPPQPNQNRLELRALYVGDATGRRREQFVAFLTAHCQAVRVADREDVKVADLHGIDVVVIDGDPTLRAQRISARQDERMPEFDLLVGVPTVLVGWVGLSIGSHWKLKTSLFYG